jgi:hypothetical protein
MDGSSSLLLAFVLQKKNMSHNKLCSSMHKRRLRNHDRSTDNNDIKGLDSTTTTGKTKAPGPFFESKETSAPQNT